MTRPKRLVSRRALDRRSVLRQLGAWSVVVSGCAGRGSTGSNEAPSGERSGGPASEVPASTMLAVQIDAFVDELSALGPRVVPRPTAGPDELIVRVEGLSLNPVDVAIARGRLPKLAPKSFPAVLGWDLAGRVEQVGPGVEGFSVGDPVYATMGFDGGAFAEYARVPVHAAALAPTRLGPVERAALPLVCCTTIQALARTDFRAGNRVLVLGGSGGVGSTAIQWLRHVGASRVVATASERKLDTVQSLGAEVIDYRRDDWSEVLAGQDFDLVYDTVGDKDAARRSTRVLRAGGDFITIAGRLGDTSTLGDVRFQFSSTGPSGAELARVTAAVEAGAIEPLIFERFTFDRIADAYARCAERVALGKIVVSV